MKPMTNYQYRCMQPSRAASLAGLHALLFTAIAILIPIHSHAQKVFSVEYENQADVKVFVTKYENQADLLVFKEKYDNRAGENDGHWFFTRYENQADKKIFFVKYENQADVKIHFVEYENQAGWRKKEKMPFFY